MQSTRRDFSIIDAPGHWKYAKNLITGCSQADAAMIVLDARVGKFEYGFSDLGKTREHALLAQTMAVKQMVIVVNKMDAKSVNYSQERFE